MDNNEALHEAIVFNNMEAFLHLLRQPGIDLNYRYAGATPLIKSLHKGHLVMVKYLIEAGCDVNLRGSPWRWHKPPLHMAVKCMCDTSQSEYSTVAQMLIQNGANINSPSGLNETPLHEAASRGNLEAVSMLLYYGADISIQNYTNKTPLMNAVRYKDICEVLINYYDDFSCRSDYRSRTVIQLAAEEESSFVLDLLLKTSVSINYVEDDGNSLLYYALRNADLFKSFWSKSDHNIFVVCWEFKSFLENYLQACQFSYSECWECLYLILESPVAPTLIEQFRKYYRYSWCKFVNCNERFHNQEQKDILPLIFVFLSFGMKIKKDDLEYVYKYYGWSQEFRSFIYVGNLNCDDYVELVRRFKELKEDFYIKGFSSLSFEQKQELIRKIPGRVMNYKGNEILETLNKLPEFPPLFELSRNAAQKFIQEHFKVTKLYQFYDAVKCLKLPQVMKDMILLEEPIYK